MGLSVPSGGQSRPDDRLPSFAQTRRGGGEAVLSQGTGPTTYRESADDHCRQEPRVPKGRDGDEARRRDVAPFAATSGLSRVWGERPDRDMTGPALSGPEGSSVGW